MPEILFNRNGKTHSMRLRPVDTKPGDVTVYEALVNESVYVFFEGHADLEVWELIELGVQSYLDYRRDDTITPVEKWTTNG